MGAREKCILWNKECLLVSGIHGFFFSDLAWFTLNGMQIVGVTDIVL
jgi:hypothetical protein